MFVLWGLLLCYDVDDFHYVGNIDFAVFVYVAFDTFPGEVAGVGVGILAGIGIVNIVGDRS